MLKKCQTDTQKDIKDDMVDSVFSAIDESRQNENDMLYIKTEVLVNINTVDVTDNLGALGIKPIALEENNNDPPLAASDKKKIIINQ